MSLKVSIATITLNSAKTLTHTIESVKRQTYDNVEYLVVDGGSTDDTMKIVQANSSCVDRWVSESDDGIYDAMNKGIQMASGDVIGLLNSDDQYNSDEVITQVAEAFHSDPHLDMVYGDLVYVDQEDPTRVVRYWKTKPYYERFFHDGLVPPHPTLFVRSRVYERHLYKKEFKYAADYEFMLRTVHREQMKTRYLPQVMVRMRLGGQTNRSWRDVLKGNREVMNAWRLNQMRPPFGFFMKRPVRKVAQFFAARGEK